MRAKLSRRDFLGTTAPALMVAAPAAAMASAGEDDLVRLAGEFIRARDRLESLPRDSSDAEYDSLAAAAAEAGIEAERAMDGAGRQFVAVGDRVVVLIPREGRGRVPIMVLSNRVSG